MEEVIIRVRMSQSDARYGGNLIAGAKMLEIIGDVATEILIRNDGDEGLCCAYDNIQFLAPVYPGDYVEATGKITNIGNTSRKIIFEVCKVVSPCLDVSSSAADFLLEPIIVCKASGIFVVPKKCQRK